MSSENKKVEKVESISIVKAEDLPKSVRDEENISKGFVELKVTRNSPPQTKISKLEKSPLTTMREAFKREKILGIKV